MNSLATSIVTDSMDRSLSKFHELVMHREAWRASVHGVTKSWTRLSNWTELNILFRACRTQYLQSHVSTEGLFWYNKYLQISMCISYLLPCNKLPGNVVARDSFSLRVRNSRWSCLGRLPQIHSVSSHNHFFHLHPVASAGISQRLILPVDWKLS